MKRLLLVLLLAVAIGSLATPAHAVPGDDILDSLVQSYSGASTQWLGRTTALARNTFALLAALEATIFVVYFILKGQHGLALLQKALLLAILQGLITFYPVWIPTILQGFERVGQIASGTPGVSPSGVMDIGIGLAGTLLEDGFGPLTFASSLVGAGWIVAVSILLIFAAFVVIAGRLAVLLIESYVLVGGSFIAAGFSACRLTAAVTDAWIGQFVRLGLEIMLTYVLITPGLVLTQRFPQILADHASGFSLWGPFNVLATSWIFAWVVWSIPSKLSHALTSSWRLGIAEAHRNT